MLQGRFLEVRVDATLNRGNYESEKVGITYAPEENEDIFVCITECKNIVYGTAPATGKVEASVKESKPKTATAKAEKVEKAEKKEEVVKESKAEETKVEEVKEEAVKEEKKSRATSRVTTYDRETGAHKKKLAEVLTKDYPTWKSEDKLKANALSASQKLHDAKTPFMDGDGNVVQEFLDKLAEIMKG